MVGNSRDEQPHVSRSGIEPQTCTPRRTMTRITRWTNDQ